MQEFLSFNQLRYLVLKHSQDLQPTPTAVADTHSSRKRGAVTATRQQTRKFRKRHEEGGVSHGGQK